MRNEEYSNESEIDNKVYAREALIMNVTEDILVAMEDKEITKTDLAKLLHKSKSFVTQTLSGSRNMTLRTLSDIAYNLDLDISIVFKDKTDSAVRNIEHSGWNKGNGIVVNFNKNITKPNEVSNDSHWQSIPNKKAFKAVA